MYVDPAGDFHSRYRFILLAQRLRRPLAAVSVLLGLAGLLLPFVGPEDVVRAIMGDAVTHPATAVGLLFLAGGLISYRPQRPTPVWRYAMSGTLLSGLVVLLAMRLFVASGGEAGAIIGPILASFSGMGSDTALVLALFFASAITRRHAGRAGLALALMGVAVLVCDVLALSFGADLFEGQMAVSTLIALVPAALAVLTLYAHRPFARVLLLAGPVGLRTRVMLVVGFFVPLLGGIVLHRMVGVPDRLIPAEALVIGVILLSTCTVALASGFQQERAERARRMLSAELHRMATMDQLTGVLNRNGIKAALQAQWTRFQTENKPCHVILFDLDHFKQINDRLGHDAGDRVLATVGRLTKAQLRNGDAVGRWGGEEFLVVTGADTEAQATTLAERLRSTIAAKVAGAAGYPTHLGPVTASFGVAAMLVSDDSPNQMIKRADLALYRAKDAGRNQAFLDHKKLTAAA